MSFRKERKYRITISEYSELLSNLEKKGMAPIYVTRTVNSVYFDNINYEMYFQSEEGTLPRKKIRVRWYEAFNVFKLEKKVSSIEGRHKSSQDLHQLQKQENICLLNLFDSDYGSLIPVLHVSYQRSYYKLESMRLTFDKNIRYRSLRSNNGLTFDDNERVMEIKVPAHFGDDTIEKNIPFSTSRFSKYCRGVRMSQQISTQA